MLKSVKKHQSINSVSLQLASAVLAGKPYVQPQKMIVLKKCWLPEHSVGCEPHYIVVARLQPSAASMAEYRRLLADCQQVSISAVRKE